MTSKRHPYLTQQLPPQTTAAIRNPTKLPAEGLDLRHVSSNPLLTRVVPKAGGASAEARRLDRVNEVQDLLVKRREKFEKRDAARRRLSDANKLRTKRMELENIQGRLGPNAAADVVAALGARQDRADVVMEPAMPATPAPGAAVQIAHCSVGATAPSSTTDSGLSRMSIGGHSTRTRLSGEEHRSTPIRAPTFR